MTKERIMIFTIAIVVTVGAIFCLYYYKGKLISHKEKGSTITETKEMKDIDENIVDPIEFSPFESARYLTVEKAIRIQTEKEGGTVETQYDSYLLSDIDLKSGTDETTDYSYASVGEGFEIEQGRATDFISEFGFDYKQMSGVEVYEKLLKITGINSDFDKLIFDQDTYDRTGQEIYVLEEEGYVTDKLMQGVGYDELISSKVFFQIRKNSDEVTIPDYFAAVVQYRIKGQIITKNLFLQVTINQEVEVSDEIKE